MDRNDDEISQRSHIQFLILHALHSCYASRCSGIFLSITGPGLKLSVHAERETDSPDFGWREGETVLQDERGREEGGIRWSGRLIRKTEILLRETRPPHTRLSNP